LVTTVTIGYHPPKNDQKMTTNKYKKQTLRKSMEPEYLSNSPKTYGIVYEGSAEVIIWKGTPMYFRSKDLAEKFKERAEPVFCDVDLEVIQFEPTAEEKRNKAIIKDLSHELLKRKRNALKSAKKPKKLYSGWLSKLEKNRKELAKQLKEEKKSEE